MAASILKVRQWSAACRVCCLFGMIMRRDQDCSLAMMSQLDFSLVKIALEQKDLVISTLV